MIVLDTSVLVRFFVNDDSVRSSKAKLLLEQERELFVPEAVFVELEHVLGKTYKTSRQSLAKIFEFLIALQSLVVSQQTRVAVNLFSKHSDLSMSDCLVVVYGAGETVASFDKRLLKTPGVKSYF